MMSHLTEHMPENTEEERKAREEARHDTEELVEAEDCEVVATLYESVQVSSGVDFLSRKSMN